MTTTTPRPIVSKSHVYTSLTMGKSVDKDQPDTHCKVCQHGIFRGQPRVWLTRPTGLSHVDCARRVTS